VKGERASSSPQTHVYVCPACPVCVFLRYAPSRCCPPDTKEFGPALNVCNDTLSGSHSSVSTDNQQEAPAIRHPNVQPPGLAAKAKRGRRKKK
jgi:hypothetical protein